MRPTLSIITTFAPTKSMIRDTVQRLSAYSLSLVKDAEVIVLDEHDAYRDVCEAYSFSRMTDFKRGTDVGVNSHALLMGDAFERLRAIVRGDVVMFVNGDNLLIPSSVSEVFTKLCVTTRGDFICLGRRNDLIEQVYVPILLLDGPISLCFDRIIAEFGTATRIPYGVDVYAWSRPRFNDITLLPVVIDGWYYDNWLVNDAYLKTKNVFYLSGLVETIHPTHSDTNERQRTTAKESTDHNERVVRDAYPQLDITVMNTPPTIPQELLCQSYDRTSTTC
jgi:hypothetical protein